MTLNKETISEFLWFEIGSKLWMFYAENNDPADVKQVWNWYSLYRKDKSHETVGNTSTNRNRQAGFGGIKTS